MLNPHTQPSSSKDRQVDLSIVSEDDEMDASRRLFTGHDSEPLSAAEGEAVSRLITALPGKGSERSVCRAYRLSALAGQVIFTYSLLECPEAGDA